MSDDPPFSCTGVDYTGPLILYIAGNKNHEKVYILLSTRAIHLELTLDMGVDSFLLVMKRFASQRGLPATLMSDNTKIFRSSAKELRWR